MGLFEKYTEKEVMCAILAVEEILDAEEFSIDLAVNDTGEVGSPCFVLNDYQRAYLGGLESERFDSLYEVVGRLDTYHKDYFYNDYEERVDDGEEILDIDYGRQVLIFLESLYCQDLLREIGPTVYQVMKDKYWGKDEENAGRFVNLFTGGELAHYGYMGNRGQSVDVLPYVVDKSIAMKIMETQSAYDVVEYGGAICEVYVDNGDISDFEEDMQMGTLFECDGVYAYGTYRELIDGQKDLIRDDFNDIGLYESDGSWGFYLSEKELQYIGMSEELSMQKLIQQAKERACKVSDGVKDVYEPEM